MEKDPVCGMMVNTSEAAGRSEYQGKTYFFCALDCKERFDHNPRIFAVQKTAEDQTIEEKTTERA